MAHAFSPREVKAGQAVYTPSLLNVYDLWVLGISNRFIWKSPSKGQLGFYQEKGIFSNQDDQLDDLHTILSDRFLRYEVKVVGCTALFTGFNSKA